jgi:hypothetical protein
MLLALSFLAALQLPAAAPQAPPYSGLLGQIHVPAPRVDAEITVDGNLDEAVWQHAALLNGFSLYSPVDQRPAPDSTQVLVWYSGNAMYFGVRAFEPHGTVTATLADRDRISNDDNVELQLDTFNERNRALVFIVNPLGVQADGTKSETGGFIPGANVAPGQNDLSADFQWSSKGHVTPWGYEVELRIPFSSLRYPIAARQDWGIQVDRHVQHSGYEETWTAAKKASASFIGQAGWLTGLTGMHHGQVVELNPELTNTVTGTPGASDWRYTSNPQLGGNVRWAVGSNFVVNGTIKPDFSQVEADATQIAADQRFALFYPEKRPFFVEGSDQFNVPNTLVYTRTIVRPDAAAKLTGKLGRADVAALTALDEGSTTATGQRPLVDILRLSQSFGEQSNVGLLYSERVGGGRANRVYGADTHIVFDRLYFAQFQLENSTTTVHGASTSGPLWEAVLDGTGRSFGFHYNVLGVAPGFQADNGFVSRTGFVEPNTLNRYTWFGKPGALLERFNVFASVNGFWKYDEFFKAHSLAEDHAGARMQFTLRGGWNLGVNPQISSYTFDPADYRGLYTGTQPSDAFSPPDRIETVTSGVSVSTPQYRRFSASVSGTAGHDVDFREASRVDRRDFQASLDLRPTSQIRLGATYQSSAFIRRDDRSRSLTTRIPRLDAEYQVTRAIFVRLVAQYSASDREPLRDPRTGNVLYVTDSTGALTPFLAQVSNGLRADWLFSYRPTPGTVFFAGYGSSFSEPAALAFSNLRRTNDGFFVKLSYLFRVL